jgi:uracil-DNA glycosylase
MDQHPPSHRPFGPRNDGDRYGSFEIVGRGWPRTRKNMCLFFERLLMSLKRLLREVRACRIGEAELPFGPRPVVQLANTARLLIVGQALGSKVHQSGVPWNDASGDRLRDWLKVDRAAFYDAARVAILPIGFCYPGAGKNGSDNPPRPECAPHWHERLLEYLPDLKLTLLVGQHAHRYYLGAERKASMTETVRTFSQHGDQFFPLPHPSWRSGIWMQRNPWFERTVIPELRNAVRKLV